MLKTCMKNHSDVWFLELNKFYLISLRWGHNAFREFTLFGLIFWQLVSIISYDSDFYFMQTGSLCCLEKEKVV